MSEAIRVTHFSDAFARTKREATYTLDELAKLIRKANATEKRRLPWLKLAAFGDERTEKGSLRHDENLLTISGVEGDYDGGAVSFEEAVATVKKARLRAILYTSPSHSPESPRWRVLCPASEELPPERRDELMGRLSALFGGAFSGESWTLSQSYYFGAVNGNGAHRVEVVDGDFIDVRPDLGWRGKNGERFDAKAALDAIARGGPIHTSVTGLIGLWCREGKPRDEVKRLLEAAFERRPEAERDAKWHKRLGDIGRCIDDIYGKEAGKAEERARELARAEGLSEEDMAELTRLAKLEGVRYERERKATAKRLGIGLRVLDWLVDQCRGEAPRRRAAQAPDGPTTPMDAEMNARYFVSEEGGTTRVYSVVRDEMLKRSYLKRSTFSDIKQLHGERGTRWLAHPQRRTYKGGIVFKPNRPAAEGEFNLWMGWSVEPRPGDWSLFKDNMLTNLCRCNTDDYDYLLGWMANAVQHPDRPAEVAVVLRGLGGVGKGVFARVFGSLFGQHFMQVFDAEHVVGKFNVHLRDTVALFADECFYAGNRRHADILKGLITEPTLVIEPKNVNAFASPNYIHLIMASNHEWVVPVGHDDRRYFCLDADDARRNDIPYFKELMKQMDQGGRAAMLYDLLHMDLSDFNVRALPQTEAAVGQKRKTIEESQDPDKLLEGWWLSVLEEGELPPELCWENGRLVGPANGEPTLPRWRSTRDLLEAARGYHERLRFLSPHRLGRFLFTAMVGGFKHRSDDSTRGYIFGSLAEHRDRWLKARGYEGAWAEGAWDPEPEPVQMSLPDYAGYPSGFEDKPLATSARPARQSGSR